MDKDEVKGKMKDVAGRAERQAGEWTGDKETEARGAARQAEGKAQKTAGKINDDLKDALKRDDNDNKDNKDKDEAA